MKTGRWVVGVGLLLSSAVLGCSSDDAADVPPSPYDPLYTVAASPSADTTKIEGLWETTKVTGDGKLVARVQFKDGKIQFASRCTGPGYDTVTVGITVSATWADDKLTVPDEGGEDRKTSNGPSGKPPLICIASLKGPGTSPYKLADSKLETLGYSFTKVAD